MLDLLVRLDKLLSNEEMVITMRELTYKLFIRSGGVELGVLTITNTEEDVSPSLKELETSLVIVTSLEIKTSGTTYHYKVYAWASKMEVNNTPAYQLFLNRLGIVLPELKPVISEIARSMLNRTKPNKILIQYEKQEEITKFIRKNLK